MGTLEGPMLDDTSPLADIVAVPADPLHGLPVCRRHPTLVPATPPTSPVVLDQRVLFDEANAHALEAGMCIPL